MTYIVCIGLDCNPQLSGQDCGPIRFHAPKGQEMPHRGGMANNSPERSRLLEKRLSLFQDDKFISRVMSLLNEDPGFVILHGTGIETLDPQLRDQLLLSIAERIGRPTRHTDDGTFVWPVALREGELGYEPTYSEQLGEAPFHTDSAFAENPENYFMLFVVRESEDGGGVSLLIDAVELIEQMSYDPAGQNHLAVLSHELFPFESPRSFTRESKVILAPILFGEPMIRYRYDIIEKGLARRPDLFSKEKEAAINYLNHQLEIFSPTIRLALKRGSLLIANNYRFLHARTSFSDPGRLLLRIRMHRHPETTNIGVNNRY